MQTRTGTSSDNDTTTETPPIEDLAAQLTQYGLDASLVSAADLDTLAADALASWYFPPNTPWANNTLISSVVYRMSISTPIYLKKKINTNNNKKEDKLKFLI